MTATARGHTQTARKKIGKVSLPDVSVSTGESLERNVRMQIPPEVGYHTYSTHGNIGRASVNCQLEVTVSYGVVKSKVTLGIQLAPFLGYLRQVAPPVYAYARTNAQLEAGVMNSDVVPWYYYF